MERKKTALPDFLPIKYKSTKKSEYIVYGLVFNFYICKEVPYKRCEKEINLHQPVSVFRPNCVKN